MNEEIFGLSGRLFVKVKAILCRNDKASYFLGFDKSKFFSFYKCLLASEKYEDLFNIPLAKCQVSETNHTFQTILDKYADDNEKNDVLEIMKLLDARLFYEKQTTKIKHALLNDGQETIQFEDKFNIIFGLMKDKSIFTLLQDPVHAAMMLDFVTSKIFIQTLFEKLWTSNLDSKYDVIGLDFLKNFFTQLLSEDFLFNGLKAFGYIQCPSQITTSKIEVFMSLRSYVRELFKSSSIIKKFEARLIDEVHPKKVRFEAASVTLSNNPTMLSELKWFPNIKQMSTHTIRMPIIQQKLCFFTIILVNTFMHLLEKGYLNLNGLLYYINIIPDMKSDKIFTPSTTSIDNYLKKIGLNLDKVLLTKIRITWFQFFSHVLLKTTPSLDNYDPEVVAIFIIVVQSKEFWSSILERYTSDKDTLEMLSTEIETFFTKVKKETLDTSNDEMDEKLTSFQDRIKNSIEQAKVIANLAQPLIPIFIPFCSETINTFEKYTKQFKFEHVKKFVYAYKGRVAER